MAIRPDAAHRGIHRQVSGPGDRAAVGPLHPGVSTRQHSMGIECIQASGMALQALALKAQQRPCRVVQAFGPQGAFAGQPLPPLHQRCGKTLGKDPADIHTCTPKENHNA